MVLQISGGAAEPSPWSAALLVGGQDTRCDAWQIRSIKICSAEPTIGTQRGKFSGFNVEDKQLDWNRLQSEKTFTRAAPGPPCDLRADLGFEPGCWDDCQSDWSSLHHCVCVWILGRSAYFEVLGGSEVGRTWHFTAVTLWCHDSSLYYHAIYLCPQHFSDCNWVAHTWEVPGSYSLHSVTDSVASAYFCFWSTKCILRWWTGLLGTLFLQL